MIKHYLKLASRNLLKYKSQTIISIMGLAIGMACFALSAFWIHYEMTYDNFHQDAERIYLVRMDNSFSGYYNYTPNTLGQYLKDTYTEIEDYCCFNYHPFHIIRNKQLQEHNLIKADSTFIRMMGVKVVKGNNHFYNGSTQVEEIAITERMAIDIFGTIEVIGETIAFANARKKAYRIGAIVSDWGKHTNFKHSAMLPMKDASSWEDSQYKTLIKVASGTDVNILLEKMNHNFPKKLKETRYGKTRYTRFYIDPITNLRCAEGAIQNSERVLKFNYIFYFSFTGVLIVLCAFVNYLTIYAERFRTRKREMAIRKVNGASEYSLIKLLSTEFVLTILLASMVGMLLVEILLPRFLHYSMIEEADQSIYGGCLLFIGGMAAVIMIIAVWSVAVFRKHSLQNAILNQKTGWIGRISRKGSIMLQFVICLLFIFCTVTMHRQLYHLRNVDTGIEYRNRGAVSIWMDVDMNVWAEKVKALPMVTEVVRPIYWPLISQGVYSYAEFESWDGSKGIIDQKMSMGQILSGEEFFRFYGMSLLSGEWVSEKSDIKDVNIMESTARMMGWNAGEAIGKRIYYSNKEIDPLTVVGVLKDCAYKAPTAKFSHIAFVNTHKEKWAWNRGFVLFKYQSGTWEECRRRIEEMQLEELPERKLFLYSEEEQYNNFLKSEDALSALLSFSSLVCILISIFGIYSLVTLSCEQRRKEIAVRKVNGATLANILRMFFKEYLILLILASLIAFPIGYWVMKQWIQTYNRQVEIGILFFILIFIGIAIILSMSIGWRVWQAARQNPAEVIKSE